MTNPWTGRGVVANPIFAPFSGKPHEIEKNCVHGCACILRLPRICLSGFCQCVNLNILKYFLIIFCFLFIFRWIPYNTTNAHTLADHTMNGEFFIYHYIFRRFKMHRAASSDVFLFLVNRVAIVRSGTVALHVILRHDVTRKCKTQQSTKIMF